MNGVKPNPVNECYSISNGQAVKLRPAAQKTVDSIHPLAQFSGHLSNGSPYSFDGC